MKLHLENSDVRQHFVVNKTISKTNSQLLYVGVFYALKKYEDMHQHNFYEFLLVTSGSGTIKVPKGSIEITKGDLVIYPPYNFHIEKANSGVGMCAYFFSVKSNKNIQETLDNQIRIIKTGDEFNSFSKTFDMAIKYARLKDDEYAMEVASVAGNLLLSLTYKCINRELEEIPTEKTVLQNIKEYLDSHYCDNISIDTIGHKFGLSNFYLCRAFKDHFGVTIKRYVIEKRIEKAKELAEMPEMKLENIGKMVSYDDRYYFSRLFKKEVGISIKKYRENIKIN